MKTKYFSILGVMVLALVAVYALPFGTTQTSVAPVADAASADYFLKIDGIPGESTDEKHKDWIEVDSWSWGVSQTNTGHGGGGNGSGKVNVQDLNFTKRIDKASPLLFKACASGQHIKQVTLTARKAGGRQDDYLKYNFFDVFCDATKHSGTGIDLPKEEVSFTYGKITMEYKQQNQKGGIGGTFTAGWDFIRDSFFDVFTEVSTDGAAQ